MRYKPFYLLALILVSPIFYFWSKSSWGLLGVDTESTLIALGRLAGLLGVYLILWQLLLIGRIKWIERYIGLDKLANLHHYNGFFGLLFVVLHGLMILFAYSSLSGWSIWAQLKQFIFVFEDTLSAIVASILLIGIVLLSIAIVRKRLKYEWWYFTHLFTYFAILLAFGHQIELGTSLQNSAFQGYWYFLYAFVFGNLIGYRFIRPAFLFWKHDFTIEKVVQETSSTVSVYITGKRMGEYSFEAGQFAFYRFYQPGFWLEKHPFSYSAAPNGKYIRITVKNLGDFSTRLRDLKAGTKVSIEGPHGVFTANFAQSGKFLLAAGGVGITPLRSLMDVLVKKQQDVVLLYGNRTSNEIIFKDELEELKIKFPNLKVVHVLSGEENYSGEKGNIDREKIARLVPDLKERDVYLCGPAAMTKKLLNEVKALGVNKSQLHFEKFNL